MGNVKVEVFRMYSSRSWKKQKEQVVLRTVVVSQGNVVQQMEDTSCLLICEIEKKSCRAVSREGAETRGTQVHPSTVKEVWSEMVFMIKWQAKLMWKQGHATQACTKNTWGKWQQERWPSWCVVVTKPSLSTVRRRVSAGNKAARRRFRAGLELNLCFKAGTGITTGWYLYFTLTFFWHPTTSHVQQVPVHKWVLCILPVTCEIQPGGAVGSKRTGSS